MKKLVEKVTRAEATVGGRLCLSHCTSPWNMDVYLAVGKEISDSENVTISGKFLCKVYEGPFRDTGKWCKEFERRASGAGLNIRKLYMWYTTCPKCAKVYGKNYVALFGRVD